MIWHAICYALAVPLALWEIAILLASVLIWRLAGLRYGARYVLIQEASFALTLAGLPVCFALAYLGASRICVGGKWHWPRVFWIFDNDEDGVDPAWWQVAHADWSKERREFVWTALRNSVNNLRYVPGISKPGRPLWYRTWTIAGKQCYAKAGWLSDGFPALSAGAGRGY